MPYVTEQNLTDIVLKRWQDIPDPRMREVMQSLIKHLHAFVREIEPTGAEWFKAIDWITRTGKMRMPGARPTIPSLLSSVAATMPATFVPWPFSSLGSSSPSTKSRPSVRSRSTRSG